MKTLTEILAFIMPNSDGQSLQLAVFFSAVALAAALLSAPLLDRAAETYAENRAFGIDRVITGSVEGKRYTIRKSVLDNDQ